MIKVEELKKSKDVQIHPVGYSEQRWVGCAKAFFKKINKTFHPVNLQNM